MISTRCVVIATTILLLVAQLEGYKILVYSNLFGHSHVKMMGSVADVLTESGHDVTLLMPIVDSNEINRKGVKVTKKVVTVDQDERVKKLMNESKTFMGSLWTTNQANPFSMFSKIQTMAELLGFQCERVMKDNELIGKMKKEKFDIAVLEPFDMCGYAFADAIEVPAHVSVLSAVRMDHVSRAVGQPAAVSYVPGTQSIYGEKMTMKERFLNSLQFIMGDKMFAYIADFEYDLIEKNTDNFKRSWRDILPESTFIFTNQIPLLDFPAPTFAKIIPIGGISVMTEKKKVKLDAKWDAILNKNKKNVLISFGSNAKSVQMPDEFKQAFLNVFKSMPDVTFIWKYEEEGSKIADGIENVHLGTWLPQNELLADPRLTMFLTHGGLASTTELAILGKPCVMVPLFADQGRNAKMMERHGGAVVLDKSNLANSNMIRETLLQVLNNDSYQKSAERLSQMLKELPTNPRETFVKHVEYAAKFGKIPTLDPYSRHQSVIEHFMIDVIAVGGAAIFVILFVIYSLVRCCIRCACSSSKSKKNKRD